MKALITLILCSLCIFTGCNSKQPEQKTAEQQTEQKEKVMLNIFNDINKTRGLLSQNGIGELHGWKSDQMGGFMSITDYYNIQNTLSNVSYYLESDSESHIKTLRFVLNINKKNESKQSVSFFTDKVSATFKSLSLDIPDGLLAAINKGDTFNADNDNFMTSFNVDRGNIDIYTLKIETK